MPGFTLREAEGKAESGLSKQRPSQLSTEDSNRPCMYRLCKIIDGGFSLFASDADTDLLAGFLTPEQVEAISSPAISVEEELSEPESPEPPPLKQANAYQKPGGPCAHCGALESPQWRRGPPTKPMLCNACGTRFRRTGSLGPPVPAAHRLAVKKREAQQSTAQSAETVPAPKKPRTFSGPCFSSGDDLFVPRAPTLATGGAILLAN